MKNVILKDDYAVRNKFRILSHTMKRKSSGRFGALVFAIVTIIGCGGDAEVTVEEAQRVREGARQALLAQTVSKPGPPRYEIGSVGGQWDTSFRTDPTTFNIAVTNDGSTTSLLRNLYGYLANYDPYERRWTPDLASWEIEVDEENDRLTIIFTLRDDLYWVLPGQSREEGIPVTSRDVVYWYDHIAGDEALQMASYTQQFVTMPNGTRERIRAEIIDQRRFAFYYPRVVANPVLSSNMVFGPYHVYHAAKEEGGADGVRNVMSVDQDPATFYAIGPYHISEYTPGVRIVLQRNEAHWRRDTEGTVLPYVERVVYRIVPDKNTEFLLFRQGTKDSYTARAEDLEELLEVPERDYTVYNGGQSLGASFISFNQNPENLDPVRYTWFIQREFRQAMSMLLNRPRIVSQVYRGLAAGAYHFFAVANPFFNPDISLRYTYDPNAALEKLASIGMERDEQGIMRDRGGAAVEFTINMGVEHNVGIEIATLFADELSSVGITANVRPIDFSALTDRLTATYDWDAVLLAFSGSNYWPSSGSNIWPSDGNLHLWHPLQREPATAWEARIDHLYNEGQFTSAEDRRREIYDEFQRIILEELPVIYTVHPFSFQATRDRWGNVYYDTLGGSEFPWIYLRQP